MKFQIEVELTIDERLERLAERLIEALWDLAEVVAPLTGFKITRK